MARATIGLNRTSSQDLRPPCWRSTKRGSTEPEMMIIGISRILLRRPQLCVIAAGDNRSPSTTAMAQRMKRIVYNLFYASIHAVCRKTLQEVNRDSGAQSPTPKNSVKNYMPSRIALLRDPDRVRLLVFGFSQLLTLRKRWQDDVSDAGNPGGRPRVALDVLDP
jgi:hypothetical protein